VTSTTGTGASGEIRDTFPQMNSSEHEVADHQESFAGEPANNRLNETISGSACIRSATRLRANDDERETRPRHQPVQAAARSRPSYRKPSTQLVDVSGTGSRL